MTGTLVFHLILFLILSFIGLKKEKPVEVVELEWGSSSGAPNQSTVQEQTESPKQQTEKPVESGQKVEKPKVELPTTKSESDETITLKSKKKKETTEKTTTTTETPSKAKAQKSEKSAVAGAGKTTGYSIEWSGVGFRKLLGGRMPVYPDGTDKEMPVLLQFTVLPDGSVTGIIPLKRSDELLEREAVAALRTWRFDPLPTQYEQIPQIGKITFNFKVE